MKKRSITAELKNTVDSYGTAIKNGAAICTVFDYFKNDGASDAISEVYESGYTKEFDIPTLFALLLQAAQKSYGISDGDIRALYMLGASMAIVNIGDVSQEDLLIGNYTTNQASRITSFSDFTSNIKNLAFAGIDSDGNLTDPRMIEDDDITEEAVREELKRRVEENPDKTADEVKDEMFPEMHPWILEHLDLHVEESGTICNGTLRFITIKPFDTDPQQCFRCGDSYYVLKKASTYMEVVGTLASKFSEIDIALYKEMSVYNHPETNPKEAINSINYYIIRLIESYGGREKFARQFYKTLCDYLLLKDAGIEI